MADSMLALRYAAASDPGLKRQSNEDSAYTSARLFVVADGMGGHVHGEVASAEAVAALGELDEAIGTGGWQDRDPLTALGECVQDAARRLTELAETNTELSGMGTTLTAFLWDGTRIAVAHIGDSRGYVLRGGELEQLTQDHTMVQTLVDSGRIAPEQASTHPRRSVLTRALQSATSVEPDLFVHETRLNDRYLLCSDGLSDAASTGAVRASMAANSDPESVVAALIELAKDGGAPDNVTCVVVDVVEASPDQQ